MKLSNQNGFTLVELMVAMVVGSIAIASAYASYDVIAKQYEKVKGVTAMQSSSRSIMRMIERDIRMAGFKWRNSKGTITFGSISEPIKITDSGNKCCDAVTVTYDYRDEASKKVERHKIHYEVKPYQGRNRLYRKRDILFPKARAGNNDVLADYVEDLQIVNVVNDMNLYAGNDNGSARIDIYNLQTKQRVGFISTINRPSGLAFGPNGLLYAGNDNGSARIDIYNPQTKQRVGSISTINRPSGLAFGPNGLLYAGNDNGSARIDIYNPQTKQRVGSISTINRPSGLAFDPNGFLYAGNDNGSARIDIYNPQTKQRVGSISTINRPSGLAFGSNGLLYAGNDNGSARIDIYNPQTKQRVGFISTINRPSGLALLSSRRGQESLVTIDLILRTKKEFGFAQPYKKKDYYEGNYDINKNDAYKRQEYSSTVLIRNPL